MDHQSCILTPAGFQDAPLPAHADPRLSDCCGGNRCRIAFWPQLQSTCLHLSPAHVSKFNSSQLHLHLSAGPLPLGNASQKYWQLLGTSAAAPLSPTRAGMLVYIRSPAGAVVLSLMQPGISTYKGLAAGAAAYLCRACTHTELPTQRLMSPEETSAVEVKVERNNVQPRKHLWYWWPRRGRGCRRRPRGTIQNQLLGRCEGALETIMTGPTEAPNLCRQGLACGVGGRVVAAVAGADHEAHAVRLVPPPRLPHDRREVALQHTFRVQGSTSCGTMFHDDDVCYLTVLMRCSCAAWFLRTEVLHVWLILWVSDEVQTPSNKCSRQPRTMQSTSMRPVMGSCGCEPLPPPPLLSDFMGGSCRATPLGCTCATSAAVNSNSVPPLASKRFRTCMTGHDPFEIICIARTSPRQPASYAAGSAASVANMTPVCGSAGLLGSRPGQLQVHCRGERKSHQVDCFDGAEAQIEHILHPHIGRAVKPCTKGARSVAPSSISRAHYVQQMPAADVKQSSAAGHACGCTGKRDLALPKEPRTRLPGSG